MSMLRKGDFHTTIPGLPFLSDIKEYAKMRIPDIKLKDNPHYKISKLGEEFQKRHIDAVNVLKEWASRREAIVERLSHGAKFLMKVRYLANRGICILSFFGVIGSVTSMALCCGMNETAARKVCFGSVGLLYLSYVCLVGENILSKIESKNIIKAVSKETFLSNQLKEKLFFGAIRKDDHDCAPPKLNCSYIYTKTYFKDDFDVLYYYCGSSDTFSPSIVQTGLSYTPEVLHDTSIWPIGKGQKHGFTNLSFKKKKQLTKLLDLSSKTEISWTCLLASILAYSYEQFTAGTVALYLNMYLFYSFIPEICAEYKPDESQLFENIQEICCIEYNQLMAFYNLPPLPSNPCENET